MEKQELKSKFKSKTIIIILLIIFFNFLFTLSGESANNSRGILIESLTVSPAIPVEGSKISVKVIIRNGESRKSFQRINVELKLDNITIGKAYISTLNPYRTITKYFFYKLPDRFKGRHKITVSINPPGGINKMIYFYVTGSKKSLNTKNIFIPTQTKKETIGPSIISFKAEPDEIVESQSIRLIWNVRNADSVEIEPSVKIEKDKNYAIVFPKKTTFYTLKAKKGIKIITKSVKVTVLPKPEIEYFKAEPEEIVKGESVTLKWSVKNYDKIILSNKGIVTKQKTIVVTPEKTQIYTLYAFRKDIRVSKSIKVTVLPKPEIEYFKAEPEEIVEGEIATLKWRVKNYDRVVLQPGNIGVSSYSSYKVSPMKDTEYRLIAYKKGVETSKTINIRVLQKPRIISFSANPTTIVAGQASTLKWKVQGADKVEINPSIGSVSIEGAKEIKPSVSATYTMKTYIKGREGKKKSLRITVLKKPEIVYFKTNKSEIVEGSSCTLSWSVRNYDRIVLEPVGEVTNKKSIKVNPKNTQQYILNVFRKGVKVSKSIKVTVLPKPEIEYFKAEPEEIVKGEIATLKWRVKNYDRVVLQPGNIGVSSYSSYKVSPKKDTKYELLVYRKNIFVKKILKVRIIKKPDIISFYVKPTRIYKGQKASLKWAVVNAQRISIKGIGEVSGNKLVVKPEKTTTYTLIAENRGIKSEKSLTIKVDTPPPSPKIVYLKMSKESINACEPVSLKWKLTGNIKSLSIDVRTFEPTIGGKIQEVLKHISPEKKDKEGSVTVKPCFPAYYTLKVKASRLVIADDFTTLVDVELSSKPVTVKVKPLIKKFEAKPNPVDWSFTKETRLNCDIVGAFRVKLSCGGTYYKIAPWGGHLNIPIYGETECKIEASNNYYTTNKKILVKINPFIKSFEAKPNLIKQGGFVRLSWSIVGGKEVKIEPDIGDVSGKREIKVRPQKTTKYRLIVKSGESKVEKSVIVRVSPRIVSFKVDKTDIDPGEKVHLFWEVAGGPNKIVIEKKKENSGKGYEKFFETGNSKGEIYDTPEYKYLKIHYRLVAENDNGVVLSKYPILITINPKIYYFTADKYEIKKGETVFLKWKALGVYNNATEITKDKGIRIVSNSSGINERGFAVSPKSTTTYTLKVRGPNGSKTKSLTIIVKND